MRLNEPLRDHLPEAVLEEFFQQHELGTDLDLEEVMLTQAIFESIVAASGLAPSPNGTAAAAPGASPVAAAEAPRPLPGAVEVEGAEQGQGPGVGSSSSPPAQPSRAGSSPHRSSGTEPESEDSELLRALELSRRDFEASQRAKPRPQHRASAPEGLGEDPGSSGSSPQWRSSLRIHPKNAALLASAAEPSVSAGAAFSEMPSASPPAQQQQHSPPHHQSVLHGASTLSRPTPSQQIPEAWSPDSSPRPGRSAAHSPAGSGTSTPVHSGGRGKSNLGRQAGFASGCDAPFSPSSGMSPELLARRRRAPLGSTAHLLDDSTETEALALGPGDLLEERPGPTGSLDPADLALIQRLAAADEHVAKVGGFKVLRIPLAC